MRWQAYEVILRLRSPLHSGWRKVGNLQMTRPYVTGRMLWGALTMRLTRNQTSGPATDSSEYRQVGEKVHDTLAFTYFYPALRQDNSYLTFWPWEEGNRFRHRLIGSYTSTSLELQGRSAAEGSLHEVEFIAPRTKDTGEQVYLRGYIFQRADCSLDWRKALNMLQLGGERGYGWGLVSLEGEPVEVKDGELFGGIAFFDGSGKRPHLTVPAQKYLLAHTKAKMSIPVKGEIEPLVGREWRSTDPKRPYVGQSVVFNDICYIPGSQVQQESTFQVLNYGLWEVCL